MGKHLVDDTKSLVVTSLRGLARANPALSIDPFNRLAFIRPTAADRSSGRVCLLSGGGSGHEPASCGFVGSGMLSVSVSGEVFASPSAKQVSAGLSILQHQPVLVIVLNYTGDRLHFGIAIERANISRPSTAQVDFLVVEDDVAVGRARSGRVGRRGLAGIVLLQKIAGGAAADNMTLFDLKRLGLLVSHNLVTVGVSLDHANVPGTDQQTRLPQDQIELGMGIHNEPGFARVKRPPTKELVRTLVGQLVDGDDGDRGFVKFGKGDKVVVLVNNLGGISTLEMHAFAEIVHDTVEQQHGLRVVRSYAAPFVTSLDGPGISITLLNLSNLGDAEADGVLRYLDRPTDAPGWNGATSWSASSSREREESITLDSTAEEGDSPQTTRPFVVDPAATEKLLRAGCKALIDAEPAITKADTVAGDGDCGTTLKSAAEAVVEWLDSVGGSDVLSDLSRTVGSVAEVLEGSMGGTGGALWQIFLSSFAVGLAANGNDTSIQEALRHAYSRLQHYTTAQVGDKTLIDSLDPFVATFAETGDFAKAAEAASKGAESTKGMMAGLGRATYVDQTEAKEAPDAGALGVAALLKGMASAL
ncbi:Dihydroxyacetone kinase 2 [Savitreella phatthalungensis]